MAENMKTLFFTGHRPQEIGKCYNSGDPLFINLVNEIKPIILSLILKNNIGTLLFGGALGWDKLAFYACLELKRYLPYLKLVHCIPFEEQPLAWTPKDVQSKYKLLNSNGKIPCLEMLSELIKEAKWGKESINDYIYMMENSDEIIYVDEVINKVRSVRVGQYHVAKMTVRNEYMVDNSDYGLAFYNGKKSGGTYSCVSYAEKIGRTMYYIGPNNLVKNITSEYSSELIKLVLSNHFRKE